MDRKKFCYKLKKARLEAGLKQEEVAMFMKLPISAISVMEAGTRKIDVFELIKLSGLYNKPIEWFFHEHNNTLRRRWYDLDPVLSESVELLRQAPAKMQRSAAFGIIGFLNSGNFNENAK
ncbi:MAG: helix-turn-helix transcriptional regulator [Candidatus Gastranaerophilales bacterium]|nr:helix-turn-helix transcriptional regulator [Candidatus Gastranaerophilales bacterium]